MTAINLPFAASATKRAPTTDELANGYGCGDADLELFDWLAWWQTGQIANAITKSGLAIDDTDLLRLAKAIRSQAMNYVGTVGGTANAITATLDPAPAALADLIGVPLRLKIASSNTGAATFNPNALGATPLRKGNGDTLESGYLVAGEIVEVIYDGSQFRIANAVRRTGDTISGQLQFPEVALTRWNKNDGSAWMQAYWKTGDVVGVLERRSNSGNATCQLVLGDNFASFSDSGPVITNTFNLKLNGSSAGLRFDNCGLANNVALGWTGSAITFRVDGTNVGNVTPSDERLKHSVADLSVGLSAVLQMRPVSFEYDQEKSEIGFAEGVRYGVIAQELEQIVPEAVSEWIMRSEDPENTTYKQVDYEMLVPVLIRAVQELAARVSHLEAEKPVSAA